MSNYDLLEMFVSSLRQGLFLTFENQAGLPLRLVEQDPPREDIVAQLQGLDIHYAIHLKLCFPRSVFLAVANHMLGEAETEVGVSNISLIEELLNLIYVHASAAINEAGHRFKPAIPYLGSILPKGFQNISDGARINCECSLGVFSLEIRMRER